MGQSGEIRRTGATIDNDGAWWVPMPSGIKFYPERPNVDDINILDIAHKLAFQCRYGGGTAHYYSVAEHCVLLSHVVPTVHEIADLDPPGTFEHAVLEFQREALLHDRVEWALQDIVRPLKEKCRPWYFEIEKDLEEVTAPLFGLKPNPPKLVMDYDYRICIDEKRQGIMCPFEASNAFEATKPLGVELQFWDPVTARTRFLHRFFELFPDANDKGWVI